LIHDVKHYAKDVLLTDMKAKYEYCDIQFESIASYPGLDTNINSSVIDYTRLINPVDEMGDNVSFGTEAGLFDQQ
jgi:hypothetical protein